MQISISRAAGPRHAVRVVALALIATSTSAQVDSWINPGSGNWDQPSNWSLGARPDSSQSVFITNSAWKAVAINPSTPINFPESMTVHDLTIIGSSNTLNTLLLNYAGTAVPLTISTGLTVADNARILNFNSALSVQSGTITVTNAEIIQDGGVVRTTNATMHLRNATYQMTNGIFEGDVVRLRGPLVSRFNQYGGTVVISDLGFEQGSTAGSNGGAYTLYDGSLYLPGGLLVQGGFDSTASYVQFGGTNRTTRVQVATSLSGISSQFRLNGGLLTDTNTEILASDFAPAALEQNGGTHIVSNLLSIIGNASAGAGTRTARYFLNGGTLIASSIILNGTHGDAEFTQTNGVAQTAQLRAFGDGPVSLFTTRLRLFGGTLIASNLSISDGGSILQSGGRLVVSNVLELVGFQTHGNRNFYTQYTLLGGTLSASNLNIGADFVIGDSNGTNRIDNPGFFSLSHLLQISNAVEQLGRFILVSNSTIDLAGDASRLSFADSSGQVWTEGATLEVFNWNGNNSGGGAEQLRFGTSQSGLTAAHLNQIRFRIGNNLLSARILGTGEVVPDQLIPPGVNLAFSTQGNNLVLAWPEGWLLQTATNVLGAYLDVSGATSPYTNNVTLDGLRFFRLRSAQ